jgi:hypothetical protein
MGQQAIANVRQLVYDYDAAMKQWAVLISHESEDKATVALPLAKTAKSAGLRVWLDSHEIHIGDSLSEKIDEALADSQFGVVILSEAFLAKRWPRKELNGLVAGEEQGRKVVLPVWHHPAASPTLADLVAADTSDRIPAVAAAIANEVFKVLSLPLEMTTPS